MPERGNVYETNVPNRLDRLPWSGFHWLVIIALGIAWILDGLEVTVVGSLAGALSESPTLHLSGSQIGAAASAYLVGAVAGSLFFGWLTDRLGRKKLFTLTVLVYLVATIACGLSWNFWSFAVFRMLTGAGIGGEYAAVNATIQELIPARRRGFTDLVVNGSFWLGAAIGALGAYVVLDPGDHAAGDRLAGGLYHRRCSGFRGAAAAALPAGKSALADDARTAGGSGTHCRGNRGSGASAKPAGRCRRCRRGS